MKQVEDFKALIAEFQNETKSNSVLDFGVWFENRVLYLETLKRRKSTPEQLAKKLLDDLDKKEGKK